MNSLFLLLFFFITFLFARDYKIYDTFLFFNEYELLRIRFEELYDEVDYFVLVESTRSFRGLEKPLFFLENKHLYNRYLSKLIHVIVEDDVEPHKKEDAWAREHFQRRAIERGLTHASANDMVIVSDVDEIPKRESIQIFDELRKQHRIVRSCGTFFRYFLNRQEHHDWCGPVISSYRDVLELPPDVLRSLREKHEFIAVPNSHWHFTSMGAYDSYCYKISSFSHWNEYPHPPQPPEEFYASIQVDLKLTGIDDLPRYVKENLDHFERCRCIDTGEGLPIPFSPDNFFWEIDK